MKSHAQVVVIGGGVVGASVLYHLTKAGWTDVVLLERRELTSGSTWHAAGGMHTLNGDPNVAKLQQYTIELYQEIERVSGQDCSIHLPGGLMLADTEVRMDFLRMAVARGRYLGMELELISAQGGARPLSADGSAVLRRCAVGSDRGAPRPDGRDPGVREMRADGGRGGLPAHAGRRALAACGRLVGRSRRERRRRSMPSTSSTPAASGRVRSAGWSASSCRSWPWSTCTS